MPQRNIVIKLIGAQLVMTERPAQRIRVADIGLVKQRMVDLSTPFREFQEDWFANEQIIFSSQGIPAWPALSPAYAARKARVAPGQTILRLTDRLYDSLTSMTADSVYEVAPQRLRIGTTVPYGQYHTRRRPHVVMLPATWQQLVARVWTYIVQPFGRG